MFSIKTLYQRFSKKGLNKLLEVLSLKLEYLGTSQYNETRVQTGWARLVNGHFYTFSLPIA